MSLKLLKPEVEKEIKELDQLVLLALKEPKLSESASRLISRIKNSSFSSIYDPLSILTNIVAYKIANTSPLKTSPPYLTAWSKETLEQLINVRLEEYKSSFSKRPELKELLSGQETVKRCYNALFSNIIGDVISGKIHTFNLEQCLNLYNNYHEIKAKITDDLVTININGSVFLDDELVYGIIAAYLKQKVGSNPEVEKSYQEVVEQGQLVLYREAHKAGKKGNKKMFEMVSNAYLRFCQKFLPSKEGEETPQEEMKDLYKEYFQKEEEK